MKKIILFCLLIAFTGIKAQIAYSWAKKTGGTSADDSQCIAYDFSGNVYIAGAFQGTVDFDPGPGTTTLTSAGSDDAYISKFDANGNFLAVYTFTNNLACKIFGIAIDNAGDIITTGGFSGSVDFDPGVAVNAKTSNGLNDIFVCKLNSSGAFQWVKAIGSFGTDDYGIAITTDAVTDILVTGYFQGTNVNFDIGASNFTMSAAGKDAFVLKLQSNGNFTFAFKIGSSISTTADAGQSVTTDGLGNIYLGGYFGSNTDFDPSLANTILTGAGGFDAFVAKYSVTGAFQWVSSFGGVGDEVCYGIANNNITGDIYATGTFKGSTDFDPGSNTFNIPSFGAAEDVFVTKLSSIGSLLWAKQMGGVNADFATGISIYPSNTSGVFVSGYFSATADFDPASTSTVNLVSNGGSDFFVSQLDLNGNYVFAKSSGGSGNEFGKAIIMPSYNLIYTVGSFSNTVDFDISPLATATLTSNGNADAFLVKYSPCPAQTVSVTASSPTICVGGSSNLNASSAVNYTWSTGATTNSITVSPSTTSSYSVTGMFSNGCLNTNTISVQVNTCTGIVPLNGEDGPSISIYPNPSSQFVNIKSDRNCTIQIMDVTGKIVVTQEMKDGTSEINLSVLSKGLYIISAKENGKQLFNSKLIKE